jgi:subtilisin family serine protease
MTKLKVPFGMGEVVFTKSTKYVGVKKTQSRDITSIMAIPAVKKVVHPHVGGFEICTVNKNKGQTLNGILDTVRSLDEVDTGSHVYHIEGSDKPLVPTGSIYVTFAKNVTEAKQKALLKEFFLDLKERRSDEKVVASVTPQSANPLKCAAGLQAKKEVKWAEPDIDMPVDHYAAARPSARLWGQMWHLQNTGKIPDNSSIRIKPGADAKVMDAWSLLDGYGSPNIVVAVIDNGIDTRHPDLNPKIVKPWDLWDSSPNLRQGDSDFTHGTPCASVAVAPQNGGMCGAAPAARLMPLSGTGFSIESTEAMFNYCIRNGADVISCSWGSIERQFALGPDKIAAITRAAREGRGGRGCVICFAAGNEDNEWVNVYGVHPDVICVGASTSEDDHPDYSNRGRELTLVAPSNGGFYPIVAARASWDTGIQGEVGASRWYYGDGIDRGSGYQHFGGTSSSTPLVAGICALILSANPNLTAREVKQILIQTADKIGSPSEYSNGHSVKYGYGRINAANAVREAFRRAGKTPGSTTTTSTPTPTSPTPKPTPTPTPAPTTSPVGSPPAGTGLFRYSTNVRATNKGFSVQAGSFSQWTSVKSVVPGLDSKFKQPVYVHVAGSGSSTIYRLLVGQFTTLAEANKLLATMKAGGVAGFVKDLSSLT